MKKNSIFVVFTMACFASCSSDSFIGDSETLNQGTFNEISFKVGTSAVTRATATGADAAAKLNNHFVVYGTKHTQGDETGAATNDALVFNQYNVEWTANTAGKTLTNSRNWEYVGKTAYKDLGTGILQSEKYWDYDAVGGYTFYAFSSDEISYPAASTDKISFTKITSGSDVYAKGYSINLKEGADISRVFFSDRVEVPKTQFGKVVSFTFRNYVAKVRVGFYETIPGYSVKIDNFYFDDDATAPVTTFKAMSKASTDNFKAALQNIHDSKTLTVTYFDATSPYKNQAKVFNSDSQFDYTLSLGPNFKGTTIGTTSATATYDKPDAGYTLVYPFESNTNPMFIRCDYTLTAEDGQGETIKVKNARVVVPVQYVQWKSNYSYTYLFKITDTTNGTTGTPPTDPDDPSTGDKESLYSITFDAVAVSSEDSQTTHSTVTNNAITTYAKDGFVMNKDIYAVIENNSIKTVITPSGIGADANKVQIYTVETTGESITEASVVAQLTGAKNGLTLTALSGASLVHQVPASDGTNYTFGTATAPAALKFTPTEKSTATKTYAYVYCTTKYVAPTYAAVADGAVFSATTTYYFKTTNGVYYAASGISADNWATYKSQLYTQTAAGTPGVYDVKVISIN